jgi:adenylosuccinate synthase
MDNIAVIGISFGDEGKGRIAHYFSPNFDYVCRYGGGSNAGHTIYRDGKKFVHHLLPSVDFRHSNTKAFLGSGMVIEPEQLLKEVVEAEKEYPGVAKRIYVDPDAFLVTPEHKEIDKKTNAHIGSTNRGIGPAYADKVGRRGFRIQDILDGKLLPGEVDIASLLHIGVNFKHVMEMEEEFKRSKLLFEGAQSVLLDINHGIYPYVSCGDAAIGGIYASGFGNFRPDRVYGVAKCYTTKSGEGPFPTEILGKEAEDLRVRGHEYGATTGRNRRIGWLDLPALKYACKKGNITDLIMTKFDILNGMKEVPVCMSYDKVPVCGADFVNAKPEYRHMPGWDTTRNQYFDQKNIKGFTRSVELATGCPVKYISYGTGEKDMGKWSSYDIFN